MEKDKAQVIMPADLPNLPEQHEIEVAWILARHYQQVIEFLKPVNDYMRKTADFIMNGAVWEIKSPMGKSKRNVERQIKRALTQSQNIIFDGRRTAIPDEVLLNRINYVASQRTKIRKLVFIGKNKIVLELIWKK